MKIEQLKEQYEELLYEHEAYKDALKVVDDILKDKSIRNNKDEYFNIIKDKWFILSNIWKYAEAVKYYEIYLSAYPRDSFVLFEKWYNLYYANQYQDAIFNINQSLVNDKNSDIDKCLTYRVKGLSYQKLWRYKMSLRYLTKAVNEDWVCVRALVDKWYTLYLLKKYTEALKCFDSALSIKKNDFFALSDKWILLTDMKKYTEALNCFDKALKINQNEYIYHNKGSLLDNMWKYREALEYFDKSLSINPIFKLALSDKGYRLYKMWKYQGALKCFKSIFSINKDDKHACKMIQKIENKTVKVT